jgi:hypothetical protein
MTETSKSYTIRQYPPNPLLDNGTLSDNDLTYTSNITNGTDISGTQYGGGSYIVKYSSYKSSNSQITGAVTNYPPSPMTASSTTINNITYRACTSDSFNYNSFDGWRAFAKIGGGTAWTTGSSYNGDGSISGGVTFGNDTNYRGHYIGIDMGEEIIIKSYHLKQGWSPLGNGNRNPKNWKLYATNNVACWNSAGRGSLNTSADYGWVAIDTRSNETSYVDTTLFTLNNSTTYRFYALQINATRSGDQYGGYCELSEWELFGSNFIYPKPWIILKNDPAYWSKIDISSSQPNWAGNYQLAAPYSYIDNSYLVNNFTGDYVTIKLPYKIYLTKYVICSTINKLHKAPQHFSIYGSINGVIWNKIVEKHLTSTSYINTQIPNSTNSTGYYTDSETKSSVAYDYYGIVVNKLIGPLDASDNNLSFSLWNVYGSNDLKERSVFEFGVVTDTSKIIGSSLKDGLIKTNNSNIFIKSGSTNTPALSIGTNNRVGVGKNIANEAFDVSGSLIANEYRIKNQNYPIIDASSNIAASGNTDISGNLTLNNNKFVVNASSGNLSVAGTLDISKNININNGKTIIDSSGNIKSQGNFDLSSNININNYVLADASGSVIMNNTLDISNNATLRSSLDIKGNIKSSTFTTNSSLNKVSIRNTSVDPSYNFHVSGSTRLEGNLDVDGNIIIVDTVQQTSEQFIINNDGNTVALSVKQIGAQPIVDLRDDGKSVFYLADNGLLGLGTTTPSCTVDVSGSCFVQQTLDVSGNLNIGGNTYLSENIQFNDILDVSQNVNINNKFFVDPSGNVDICGNMLIYGYLISNGNNANSGGFQQDGNAIINGELRVLYNIDISQNLRVLDTFIVDASGNIKSKGQFDLSNNLRNGSNYSINTVGNVYSAGNIDISKNFNINNGVFSADVSGNIIVNGFIDISKNLYVNGNKFTIDQSGNITAMGTIDISQNLTINTDKFIVDANGNIKSVGNLDISNNFIINNGAFKIDNNGNISSQNNFDISGNMSINGQKLIVSNTGNITSTGKLDISNNFSINTDKFAVDSSGNTIAKGNVDISNNLSIGNNTFNVDASGNIKSTGSLDISKNLKIGNTLLTVDHENKRVGVNTTTPEYSLDVSGQIVTNKTMMGSTYNIVEDAITNNSSVDSSTVVIKMNNANVTPTNITLNEYYYPFTSTSANYTFTCTQDTTCDILMIGGGGGGSDGHGGGGGAGALVFIKSAILPTGTYTFTVGSGGNGSGGGAGNKGGDTKIIFNGTNILVAEGGGAGGGGNPGGNGGSGGGGDGWTSNGSGGNASPGLANNPGSSIVTYNGVTGIKYGNNGGVGAGTGGGGGGAATPGIIGDGVATNWSFGGEGRKDAIINSTTYDFVTVFGTTLYGTNNDNNNVRYFAGGGGGGRRSNNGGKGGGGSGGGYDGIGSVETGGNNNITPGVANTGSGGGGGGDNGNYPGAAGGSGIILLKFNYTYIKSYSTVYNNNATFGYRDANASFIPSIVQLNTGQTFINSLSQYIHFNFGNDNKCKMDASGNLTLNGDIFIYSDGRIKENVTTITSALDKVNELSGITYNIINKPRRQIGVVAQEVEKVLPEVIKEEDGVKTVAYPNMVGLLIEALKELNDRVDQT